MEVGEIPGEMSWDFCRIFNKPIYYAIRKHVLPVKGEQLFTTLSSSDIVKSFVEFYNDCIERPLTGGNYTNPYLVVKVLKVHQLKRIYGRSAPGLRIDGRILKTNDTVHVSSQSRDRTLIATGTLAEILSRCLQLADIIVITRDRRFMDDVLFAHNHKIPDTWRDIHTSKTVHLNSPFRNNTLVFMYRHDGQFNYRSWTAHMDNLKAELQSSMPLDVRMYKSSNHGACVSVSSSRYCKLAQGSAGKNDSVVGDLDYLDSQVMHPDTNFVDWSKVYSFHTWIAQPEDCDKAVLDVSGEAEATVALTKASSESLEDDVPAGVPLLRNSDAHIGVPQNHVAAPNLYPVAKRPLIFCETQEFVLADSQV